MKIALAIAAVVASIAVASPAQAKSDDCVVYSDWVNIERGSMSQVQDYLGTKGFVVSTQQQGQYVLKQYDGCKANTFMQVFYSKNAAGLYMSQYASWWHMGMRA